MKYGIFLLLAAASLTGSGAALAQHIADTCPEKPVDEASQRALARIWFDKGDKFADEEKHVEALGAYNCSLRMIEHSATKFNAAQSAHLAGLSDVAIQILEDLLKKTQDQQTAKEAVEFIQKINEDVAAREPPLEPEPEPQPPVEQTTTDSDESPDDHLAPAPDFEAEIIPAPRPVEKLEDDEPAPWMTTVGFVAVGVSGAALITGGVLQILAGVNQKTTGETADFPEWEEAKSSLERYQTGAYIAFAAGGAILGGGVALLWLGRDDEESNSTVAVAPTPTGVLVRCGF